MKNRSAGTCQHSHLSMLGVLLAAACIFGCSAKTANEPAAISASNVSLTPDQRKNIHLYTVQEQKFHKTVQASGAVDFDNDQSTSVLAPFSGPVSHVLVSLGDRVKPGAALAVVDSPDFAAALSSYRKSIATAQTARRLADLEKDLVEHQGVAKREQDQAATDALNAEADREASKQALQSLSVPTQTIQDIEQGRPVSRLDGTIRAPIAGTVVEKLITPGQLLQAGTTPCFTIADVSKMWVMAQIFGADLASIAVGDPAEVESAVSSGNFTGVIDNISALVDPDTRSVVARVVVKNPGDFLKKQMYVRVRIQSRRESSGLLVPASAILRDDLNLPFVYLAQADGSFARQHVTLGYRNEDAFDITEGLQAGNRIVIEGGIFVQFMQNQ